MYKGFDEKKFMSYLEQEFNGLDSSFARGLVEKLIEYGHKHEQIGKDMFCEWLESMIPEITFGEVAAFMEDDCLTESGKAKKDQALSTMKYPKY